MCAFFHQFLQLGTLHMSDEGVSTSLGIKERAAQARHRFNAHGENISAWARKHGFSIKLVHAVLSGQRSCNFGESHRIAVALGIKPQTGIASTDAPNAQLAA